MQASKDMTSSPTAAKKNPLILQSMQSSQQMNMRQLIADKNEQIEQMYDVDKDDDQADSRRGSFHEFLRLQKVMKNLDEDQEQLPSPTDAHASSKLL